MAIFENFFIFAPFVLAANDDTSPPSLSDLEIIFSRILNIALTLGGLAVFIMLIMGGFKYLTSGGDPKQTKAATNTITMAIIGLVAALASWFVLKLIAYFTGFNDQLFIFKLVE